MPGSAHEDAVKHTVQEGKASIQWLIDQGVKFDTEAKSDGSKEFHLTQEGGHSHRRIIHAADATGKEVSNTLIGQVLAHPNIELYDQRLAIDLIIKDGTCEGAYVFNRNTGIAERFQSKCTILATGGASKVYLYTSNPDGSSGDGIAMPGAPVQGCQHGIQSISSNLPLSPP